MNQIRLFCFPSAGGSSAIYNRWKNYLSKSINLQPIELAGRGKRNLEKPYDCFEEAVEDVFSKIEKYLYDMPFAFYGHSFGSWLAYELGQRLKILNKPDPVHIFFSGRKDPQADYTNNSFHKLPDEQFIMKILELGGMPKIIAESEDLLKSYIPLLRTDCKVVETYKHSNRNIKLDCDFSILYGDRDPMTLGDDGERWGKHTSKECNTCIVEGGHFFIIDNIKKVTTYVNDILCDYQNIFNNSIGIVRL